MLIIFVFESKLFNQYLANIPILKSQKTPENQRFSDVFMGYKIVTLARNR